MTQQMILICSFLFVFTHSKQATYMYLLAHFVFIAAIFCYYEQAQVTSKHRNDGRVELDIERFPHEKNQNRASMFWSLLGRHLFSNFAEAFARITFHLNKHSPVKIRLLKVPKMSSATLTLACWQYIVPLLSSSQVSATFAKQLTNNLASSLLYLSSGNHTDYLSLSVVSERDFLTGLEVTIPSFRIFRVTGPTFSPGKGKFVRILA